MNFGRVGKYETKQAYMSISLDATGLLRFLAFWVARKGGADGRRLYAYLYVFFLVCGVVVGNVRRARTALFFLALVMSWSRSSPTLFRLFLNRPDLVSGL